MPPTGCASTPLPAPPATLWCIWAQLQPEARRDVYRAVLLTAAQGDWGPLEAHLRLAVDV